jgi:thiol-disulfide isomerase/thioredoxin
MRRREAIVLGAAGAAALAAGALVGALGVQSASGAGKLLASSFPDLSGRVRRLSEWQGRVTLFNFFATWCSPCRDEMPILAAAAARFGFSVVGIGIDHASKIVEFIANIGIQYEILIADASAIDLMKALGNRSGGLPFTVVLDGAGRISARKLGPLSAAELQGIATPLLR